MVNVSENSMGWENTRKWRTFINTSYYIVESNNKLIVYARIQLGNKIVYFSEIWIMLTLIISHLIWIDTIMFYKDYHYST